MLMTPSAGLPRRCTGAAIAVMLLAVAVTRPFIDKSIAGGAMGALQYFLASNRLVRNRGPHPLAPLE